MTAATPDRGRIDVSTVVVSSRSFGSGDDDPTPDLEADGHRVVRVDPSHDLELVGDALGDAVAWIAGTGPVRPEHLDAAPRLRVVARYGVGVDAVDLEAAVARGVTVTNTPGANAEAVADHTIGLTLAALRDVVAGDAAVRAGDWSRRRGRELGSCTVGIVGFGAVGRAVARRLVGFGSPLLVHDPYLADDPSLDHPGGAVSAVELDGLLQQADVVTLHAPGGDRPLIDAGALALMRADAVLVNAARAALVDEAAVADALVRGRLGAHASDVVATEHGRRSPLLEAPRTTLTPHVAGQTVQAIDRMGRTAADDVRRVLRGDAARHPVVTSDHRSPPRPGRTP